MFLAFLFYGSRDYYCFFYVSRSSFLGDDQGSLVGFKENIKLNLDVIKAVGLIIEV
jgi:hypothetical protein